MNRCSRTIDPAFRRWLCSHYSSLLHKNRSGHNYHKRYRLFRDAHGQCVWPEQKSWASIFSAGHSRVNNTYPDIHFCNSLGKLDLEQIVFVIRMLYLAGNYKLYHSFSCLARVNTFDPDEEFCLLFSYFISSLTLKIIAGMHQQW